MSYLLRVGFGYGISATKNVSQRLRRYSTLNTSKVNISLITSCQASNKQLAWGFHRCITQKSTSRREEKFKIKDGVPPEYDLVYKAPMDSYITVVQGVSTLSLAIIASVGVYEVFLGTGEIFSNQMIENKEQFIIAASAFILANVSMLSVAFRYPLRMYNRENDYKLIFTGILPTQTRTIEFKSTEMKKVDSNNSILPWRDSIFKINRKKVFILDHFFRKPADFTKMMEGESKSSD